MSIEEIKELIKKKASIFHTGGIKPTKELYESWIGRVAWEKDGESLPIDKDNKEMLPIATLFIKQLPFYPAELSEIECITIFMSKNVWNNLVEEDLSPWFTIRTYHTLDTIVACDYTSAIMKPFPLLPKLVENDFPVWDGGGLSPQMEELIYSMEKAEKCDYYDDICEEIYSQHKIGGYPSFCQSGHWFTEEYPFVMQISSDEKANFNIVDSGSFYFYYNPQKEAWKVHCDFY